MRPNLCTAALVPLVGASQRADSRDDAVQHPYRHGLGAQLEIEHPSSFVDTFLGVSGGGHVFPGATAPFGNVKVGVDTTDLTGAFIGGGNNAGWSDPAHSNVTAISYLHVSGTGGGAKYGVIAQTPTSIDVNFDALNGYTSRFSNERSSPGYYAFALDDWGVNVSLAASPSVGTALYDFSRLAQTGARAGQVLIDLGHVLGAGQTYREGHVKIHDDLRTITGHGTYRGGWNCTSRYLLRTARTRN